jgi:hypothetical protein
MGALAMDGRGGPAIESAQLRWPRFDGQCNCLLRSGFFVIEEYRCLFSVVPVFGFTSVRSRARRGSARGIGRLLLRKC